MLSFGPVQNLLFGKENNPSAKTAFLQKYHQSRL